MEAIDQIRKVADLVEIVGDYTKLKKKGQKMIGNCPFCKAKDTFTVDPKKNLFHCFGCGAGGDVFTFVMEKLNLSFPEAMKELSKKYHLENVKYECLSRNVENYRIDLRNCFDGWMREEIKDKEFIRTMTQLITRLAGITGDDDEIPF